MGLLRGSFYLLLLVITLQFEVLIQTQVANAWVRDDLIPGSRYTSATEAALGDSALSMGDDMSSGLFYNPANLAKIRKFNFSILNYSIMATGPLMSNLGVGSFNVFSLKSFEKNMNSNPNQFFGNGMSLLPVVSLPFLTLGLLAQVESVGRSDAHGKVIYGTVSQLIPTAGVGYRFFDGSVRVGYSLQFVNQAVSLPTGLFAGSYSVSQGSALSHNLGISASIPSQLLPTLSLVVRNAFGAQYGQFSLVRFSNVGTVFPASDPMTIDTSLAFNLRLAPGVHSRWSVAYRDLGNQSNCAQWMCHVGAGTEVAFQESFFLRLGMRAGYPSVGLGMKKPGADLSMAWYTEEVGGYYHNQGETKFVLQYQNSLY